MIPSEVVFYDGFHSFSLDYFLFPAFFLEGAAHGCPVHPLWGLFPSFYGQLCRGSFFFYPCSDGLSLQFSGASLPVAGFAFPSHWDSSSTAVPWPPLCCSVPVSFFSCFAKRKGTALCFPKAVPYRFGVIYLL